jgi:hypothetical protein
MTGGRENPMKTLIIILSILFVLVILLLYLKNVSISNMLDQSLEKLPSSFFERARKNVTEDDLDTFPKVVKQYFISRGMVGKPLYQNAILYFSGDFKMSIDQPWIKVKTVQFNVFIEPLRLFFIRADMMGLFSMVGSDIYQNGEGNMKGKLMRLIQIFDEKGESFNIGELTTYLNDAFLMFPWAIVHLKDRFSWEEINENNVKFKFTDHGMTVGAELIFNANGLLENYITEDRFLNRDKTNPDKYTRTKWSTPVGEYKEFEGQLVPTYGQAIWHYDDVEFCYAKFRVEKIEFDVKRK